MVGLSMMGLCSIGVILIGIFFPKFVIKDYIEECDLEDYVTVYFYDGYKNGMVNFVDIETGEEIWNKFRKELFGVTKKQSKYHDRKHN